MSQEDNPPIKLQVLTYRLSPAKGTDIKPSPGSLMVLIRETPPSDLPTDDSKKIRYANRVFQSAFMAIADAFWKSYFLDDPLELNSDGEIK